MICPTCGTHIADGLLRCPACHASVAMTIAMPVLQGRWCPSCGVSVEWEAEVCPNCGLPLESTWGAPDAPDDAAQQGATGELPEVQEELEAEADAEPAEAPHIESAIPAEDDPTSKVALLDQLPHSRPLVVASIASALVIGGLALAITQPWNPNRNSIRATEEADTSMAGFPGTVESLSGQDQDPDEASQDELTGEDAVFAQLVESHEKLGRYADRARENEALFMEVAFTEDLIRREEGKRKADALAIDLDNFDEEMAQLRESTSVYGDDVAHMLALSDWLRGYDTTLCTAWEADMDSKDTEADRPKLLALLEADQGPEGKNIYLESFEKSYDSWKPEKDGE